MTSIQVAIVHAMVGFTIGFCATYLAISGVMSLGVFAPTTAILIGMGGSMLALLSKTGLRFTASVGNKAVRAIERQRRTKNPSNIIEGRFTLVPN